LFARTEKGDEVAGQTVNDRVRSVIEPDLIAEGLEVVDVEHTGATLRVTVDRPGGIDLDTVSDASRRVSELLDRHDVVPGRYTLEVSSPGIERSLRTPEHYRRFVGSPVTVKTRPGAEGERRVDGQLESADDDGIVVSGRSIPYADIERARTRFEWPAAPRKATTRSAAPQRQIKPQRAGSR